MIGQQPAAAGHGFGDTIWVGAVQVNPDAQGIGQVRGLVDPLGLGDQQLPILQGTGDPRGFPFMVLKPGQPLPMGEADAYDQRWVELGSFLYL